MKKTFYLCMCALAILGFNSQKASAQVIASHYDLGYCALALDSMSLSETGYVPLDTMLVYWGDGTEDKYAPSFTSGGSAWYDPFHFYTAPGVYSRKIVLISGGVRVDSVTYTYSWDPCEEMHIWMYSDNNSNCTYDGGDRILYTSFASIKIDSAGVPVDTISSNYSIYYQAHGPVGTVYTFTVIAPPPGFVPTCPVSGVISVTISPTYDYYEDTIGFECDPTACLDNSVYATFSAAVIGARASMYLATSSCTSVTRTATLTFSPKYTLSAVYGATYTISGNVITFTGTVSATAPRWIVADFNPVGTLTMGDTAQATFFTPTTGDCNTANNTVFVADTITASLDPNHKTVKPNGPIAAGTQLEYMLQFENTGNGVAQNIHLLDTLSDNLDINTIKQIASSAKCRMILLTAGGHNIVKFDFANINLPDSSHHGTNEGFVSFTINAKTTLTPGTNIDNKAGIYFDVNEVVMTNNVRSTIPVPSGVPNVKGNVVEVYPNPVTEMLTVNTTGNFNTMTVTNTLGQVVVTGNFTNKHTAVNVKGLPAGMYYITLKGEDGVKVQKFEKL